MTPRPHYRRPTLTVLAFALALLWAFDCALAAPELSYFYRHYRGIIRTLPNWMPVVSFPDCAPHVARYMERRFPGLTARAEHVALAGDSYIRVEVGAMACDLTLRDWASYPAMGAWPLCLIAHEKLRTTVALGGGR